MKIIAFLLTSLFLVTASAKDYKIFVPNAPGSGPDFNARTVAKTYNRLTGNNLIVENVPGGESVPAYNRFKNTPNSLIVVTSSMNVVQEVLKTAPWTDADFDYVGIWAWHPLVVYANAQSGVKNMHDFKTYLQTQPNIAIGGDNITNFVNIKDFVIQSGAMKKTIWVRYKGSAETIVGTVTGNQPFGVAAVTPAMVAAHKAGKITIIGTSLREPQLSVDITIPPIDPTGKIYTYTGWSGVALNNDMDPNEAQQLKKDLWVAIVHPDTQEAMTKYGFIHRPIRNGEFKQTLKDMRKDYEKHKEIPGITK